MQIQVCGRERVLKNLAPCLVICILEGHMACVSDAGRSQLIINMDYLKKKKSIGEKSQREADMTTVHQWGAVIPTPYH